MRPATSAERAMRVSCGALVLAAFLVCFRPIADIRHRMHLAVMRIARPLLLIPILGLAGLGSTSGSQSSIDARASGKDWSATVRLYNRQPFPVCLDGNYHATSRLTFYDRQGRRIASGGFEGRPRTTCKTLGPHREVQVRYVQQQFPLLNVRTVSRLCYQGRWTSEDGRHSGMFDACAAITHDQL
jgi:hypothetical protein